MKKLFDQLETILQQKAVSVIEYFNPPILNRYELSDFVSRNYTIESDIPENLFSLYEWHNGTNTENFPSEDSRFGYFAYELCLLNFTEIQNCLDVVSIYDFRKNGLFPICTSFNGEWLAVNLENESIIYCSTSDFEIESMTQMFDTIESFIKTVISLYVNHCYIVEDGGVVSLDTEKYEQYLQIGQSNNPMSEYWSRKLDWLEQ